METKALDVHQLPPMGRPRSGRSRLWLGARALGALSLLAVGAVHIQQYFTDSVSGELGIVERPDGTRQVALDGKLLNSFVEDEPGEVTGDGFEDAFDGQTLTWHVVHPDGSTGTSDDDATGPAGY